MKKVIILVLSGIALQAYAGHGPNPCWDAVPNVSQPYCSRCGASAKFVPYLNATPAVGSCTFISSRICNWGCPEIEGAEAISLTEEIVPLFS